MPDDGTDLTENCTFWGLIRPTNRLTQPPPPLTHKPNPLIVTSTVLVWQLYSGFRLEWWQVALIPFYGP